MKLFFTFIICVFLCFNIHGQNIYSGKIVCMPNPCQTEPCLPGTVSGLKTTSNDYVLTINSFWIWSGNRLIVDDIEYLEDDEVEITGTITTKQDINSNEYIELEIESIKKTTFSNITTLPSDNYKIYFDAANQIIIMAETLQNQSLTFELIDTQGRMVLRKTGLSNKSSINAGNLSSGIYLYCIIRNRMIICTGKLLKSN